MARPRIFISSTFYDLRQVRTDIERSIQDIGYETIRHETGGVPYSKDEPLESGAYREIELSDIIVFITGGRFGTQSVEAPSYSISQAELKRALNKGIPVFIFVDSGVFNEYSTYKLNKESTDIQYSSVNDIRVFQFLDELFALPRNNPITKFEVASDITDFLKEQFSGLFHRFLQEQKRQKELNVLDEMNSVSKTLKELVGFLTEERKNKDDAINSILLTSHPVFRRLADLTRTPYRVYFSTRQEMGAWLKARNWTPIKVELYDRDSVDEWSKPRDNIYLKFTKEIFDADDRLIPFTENEWKNQWISQAQLDTPGRDIENNNDATSVGNIASDPADDIPF